MPFVLYPSMESALLAAGEWARDIRPGWKFGPLNSKEVIDPDLIQPCDRARLSGAHLSGFTIRAYAEFVGYGTSLFAAAWEVHQ